MTADAMFIARLVGNSAIKRVAMVHDFMPFDDQPRDLTARAASLRYAASLAWLRQYDLFLPVSVAARRRLNDLFGPPPSAFIGEAHEAADIWSAILRWKIPEKVKTNRTLAGCTSAGRAKPRVAILSPFPPVRSGVADYSAACVEALARYADLALFSPEPAPAPRGGRNIAPLSAFAHLSQNFDRVISVLGNSGYHADIYDLLTRHGGAAICHDSRLLHFYIHKNGAPRAARLAGEELQREVTEAELERWVQDETRREATLLGEAARHAQPLIFHAQASAELARQRFNADARYLPFALPHSWSASVLEAAEKRTAKCRLGFDPCRIHIASFGFLTSNKGAGQMLAALQLLVRSGIAAHLHFVGEPDAICAPVLAQAAALGLEHHVSLTGYVAQARYRDYFLAADLGLQLRNTGAGSISGALQDCIAAGLPSVANEVLAAALDAPSYVARVADVFDPGEIAAALAGLIENPPAGLAEQRAEYCDFHSMENYAIRLCEMLELEI